MATLTEDFNFLADELLTEFGFELIVIDRTKQDFDIDTGDMIYIENQEPGKAVFIEDIKKTFDNFADDRSYSTLILKTDVELNRDIIIRIDSVDYAILDFKHIKSEKTTIVYKVAIGEI